MMINVTGAAVAEFDGDKNDGDKDKETDKDKKSHDKDDDDKHVSIDTYWQKVSAKPEQPR